MTAIYVNGPITSLSRMDLLAALTRARTARRAASYLGANYADFARQIRTTRKRTNDARLTEAVDLRTSGVSIETVLWACGVTRAELVERQHAARPPAPSAADLWRDADHIAAWGHV